MNFKVYSILVLAVIAMMICVSKADTDSPTDDARMGKWHYGYHYVSSGGLQAWITSAVEEKSVEKAIVLGGSLRRVATAKKLIVYTTIAVSKSLREKLWEVFDLVLLLDKEVQNGLSLDDYAKVQGFALCIFTKCVYLSPNALILRNCDEIFEKYTTFAALHNGTDIDSTVYLFTPNTEHGRALEKLVHFYVDVGDRPKGCFGKYFNLWIKNNMKNSEKLDEKYNLRIVLDETNQKSLEVDSSIVNFVGNHPLDMSEGTLQSKMNAAGCIERYAVEKLLQYYDEDIRNIGQGIQRSLAAPTEIFTNEPIAIVGMSFRLPGGNTVDEFWDLLAQGKEAIQVLPTHRWTKEHTSLPCNDRNFQAGFLNLPIDEFDAKFFGISPKEAVFLDPQQRLLHEVCWEAMEDAMIDPLKLQGTNTGVFVGSWVHDYRDIVIRADDVDFFRAYMGNSIASGAARLSHFLGTTGPSIATESGCSSAIVAVHMACKSLRDGETNLAMACGVNLLINPVDKNTLSFVVAPDGRCKTFDEDANGFGRAEACAVLLMKRYSDAMKDGDNIWGLIRGSAVTQEGLSKSLGTPTVHCESLAMELALKDANLKGSDVGYVEAHGTGTAVGDPMEIAAITKAYGNGREEPLIIGSVKTNVGHTESVSGITGIIKVLLSMKNETIPPHLNLKKLNPKINLQAIPAEIPLELTPWPKRSDRIRVAGVSSFGISGTDGHAIIQEPPAQPRSKINFNQDRPLHIMKFSAKCMESLDALISKYETIFTQEAETESDQGFANMAYSANHGRSTFSCRAVIVADNFTKASKILREKSYKQVEIQGSGSSLCFLFTGQGSQYPNMAASLYATSPVFKYNFDICSQVLRDRYDIRLNEVLWGSSENKELSRTLYSQTSIFCVEYCLLKMWDSWGVKPDYVVGHSLGEFAAAVAAEVISFEDALMLVAERSKLIDSLTPGKMLVIKSDKKTVDEIISKFKQSNPMFWVDYAALNSPDQTVVAGDSAEIDEFAKFCKENQLKSVVLAATHAFHSRHMDPILEAYRQVALTVKQQQPSSTAPKFVSGMEGKMLDPEEIDADYWVRHTREKVNFIDACKAIQSESCGLFLEVGPHPVLSALVMMNTEGQSVTCLPSIRRKEEEWTTMLDTLSKLYLSEWKGEIDWKGFDKHYQRKRVSIPFYPFNRKPMWIKTRPPMANLHPLLGKVLPNASGCSVFEQSLTLKKADFVQDHVIGNTIIFPGAGFLEMCLVGGHSSVQAFGDTFFHPRRPVALKALKIKSPLALSETQLCVLQTVVTLDTKDDEAVYTVTVSRLDDSDSSNGGQWRQHATAEFIPVAPVPAEVGLINVEDIKENWEPSDTKDFYARLPEVGLRFGPKFQSLLNGWSNEEGLLFSVKVPENYNLYVAHPVIADAMIQAAMMWSSKDKIKKKLQVPVHIGEFIMLEALTKTELYIYCSAGASGTVYSLLTDPSGKPLAYMSSIDFAETTVKLVEGMIHQQHAAMPQLWEEIWIPSVGPMQSRIDHNCEIVIPDDILEEISNLGRLPEEEARRYSVYCTMSNYYFLRALYDLGLAPSFDSPFSSEELIQNLGIQYKFKPYVKFFLKSLTNVNFLRTINASSYLVTSNCPNSSEVSSYLNHLEGENLETEGFGLMQGLGNKLGEIFKGETDSLSILFPNDSSKPSAQKFYDNLFPFSIPPVNAVNLRFFQEYVQAIEASKVPSDEQADKPVIRVLEIGAGSGTFSELYLETLSRTGIAVEYHYTDISAAFFGPAEKRFQDHINVLTFKKFNMTEDPFEQGYGPEYFDFIIGFEVFHVAQRIKPMLQNLRLLLKPNGFLFFYETTKQCPRITFIFGLLEDYWKFEDTDLRIDHITLSEDDWRASLKDCGYSNVQSIPIYNDVHRFFIAQASSQGISQKPCQTYFKDPMKSWIVFTDGSEFAGQLGLRLDSIKRRVRVVACPADISETTAKAIIEKEAKAVVEDGRVLEGILYLWSMQETRDQAKTSLPFVSISQYVCRMEKQPKIFAITKGLYSINGSEVQVPSAGTLIGIVKAIRNEYNTIKMCHMDLSPDTSTGLQVNEVFSNLWEDNDGIIAFRGNKRFVPKIASHKNTCEPLSLPNGCDRFQLVLPESRLISDLEFSFLEPYTLKENEVEVETKAFSLNFRDLFAVLKPVADFEHLNSLGLDFVGVVVRKGATVANVEIGDRVVGFNWDINLSLPSHVKVREESVIRIPDEMTFNEGVTLPAVFFTALYCLVDVAKMKAGETLLIHTASGGVGLCAIQLAQKYGVNIIATAGSTAKRNFLRNLGIPHVFNSRTTEFSKQILKVTKGRGVDIVLNSITGPGMKEASLDALAANGRFIEMSKLNVWSKEEVRNLRPDVFYEIVDLPTLPEEDFKRLTTALSDYMENGLVKPIPYERFDALNIRGALTYMQKAKHIGKVVCVMPEVKVEKSKFVVSTRMFNEQSTYLVTGGLGGIGYEVVKWMLNNGAKHVAIASRSSPKPGIGSEIQAWNRAGSHVAAFQVDIGDYVQCKQLLDHIGQPTSGFPKLRGVMHAAGVLQDATIDNQSWEKFQATYNPKVDGSWNLHDLTKDKLLEHFVLFSSIAAVLGSPGQVNHSASNSFEDTLARHRRSIGLTATTVNWGTWGETGVATEVDLPGIRPISTKQGLLALETFLSSQQSHVFVVNVESFAALSKLFPNIKTSLADKRLLGETKLHIAVTSHQLWSKIDTTESRDEKLVIFKEFVKSTVRLTLKMDQDEAIEDHTEFQVLGVDSLMMLEMKNGLQNVLGNRLTLSAAQLKDCSNTTALANRLVDILEGHSVESLSTSLPTVEELFQLLKEDSILPATIQLPQDATVKSLHDIETVLLTGVTGTLGPYLLRDLSRRQHIKRIICLVRKSVKDTPEERLLNLLQRIDLLQEVNMAKVVCISGDLTDKLLGLEKNVYDKLANEVDCVFHSAVRADHTANYMKSPDSKKVDVRTVNVGGTLKLLEFATHSKLKHFYSASTLLIAEADENGYLSEDWVSVEAFKPFLGANPGYPVSKLVSELLLKQAVERGVPAKVFRFGLICGDSRTGRCNFEGNHILLRWLAYMRLGCMPEEPAPYPVVPVDHCSKLSIDVFFNENAENDVYNVCMRNVGIEQVFIQVAKDFGINIEPIPMNQFMEKMKFEKDDSPLAVFKEIYERRMAMFMDTFETTGVVMKYILNSEEFFICRKLLKLYPEYEKLLEPMEVVVQRDLRYLKELGVFDKFGI